MTGGGSGIGKLLALKLARLGCKVVLWDVNQAAVEAGEPPNATFVNWRDVVALSCRLTMLTCPVQRPRRSRLRPRRPRLLMPSICASARRSTSSPSVFARR